MLTKNIDPKRIIGCVVYPAAAATAPGVIHHVEGDRFPIGELDGKETERVKELHDVFIKAGLKSLVLPDIRSEIWLKAWGNLSFNPISALTHATLVDICQFAETRAARGQHDEGSAGHRAKARRHLPRHASTSASPAPKPSARTRPRCCRTSKPAARWKPRR